MFLQEQFLYLALDIVRIRTYYEGMEDILTKTVVGEIRAELARKHEPLKEFAARAEIPENRFYRIMSNRGDITLDDLHRISKNLGIGAFELLERAENQATEMEVTAS